MPREHDASSGFRLFRLQNLVFEELQTLFREEVEDPSLSELILTAVELSVDFRHARVHYTIPSSVLPMEAERALTRATPYLRYQLALSLSTKRSIDLHFRCDGVHADAVESETEDDEERW